MDSQYWFEGNVSIPEESKEEFNHNVLKLLDLGGIRKKKKIMINGKEITVVHKPMPDENGIVRFDHSIFDYFLSEGSYYDMDTCTLHLKNCWETGISTIMNAIMAMQEAYSTEPCYLMYGKEISGVYGHALLIEQLIGLRLSFATREKIWDMFMFFKSKEMYNNITHLDIAGKLPLKRYCNVDIDQVITFGICAYKSAVKPDGYSRLKKADIKDSIPINRIYYAYELFKELISSGNDGVRIFLKELLESDISERENMSKRDDAFGDIAGISLYEPPVRIAAAYGWAVQEEFWEIWSSLEITGYEDIYKQENKENNKEIEWDDEEKERIFYKLIKHKNEDDFLELYDNQELSLSDDMKSNLEDWKSKYEAADESEIEGICMEAYIADIFQELVDVWWCRYINEELINEFMEHADDARYKKALLVFRKYMDYELRYFPELTAYQAKEWFIKKHVGSKDCKNLIRYAALLANRARRQALLGF